MIPKEGIVPPGGFHFVEGPSKHRIDGHSFLDVAEKLLRYRVANGVPVGEPLKEVHAFVCEQWPHFCHVPSEPIAGLANPEPSFTIAVLQNITALWQRQANFTKPLVSDTEAERRAQICRGCPHQKDWADYPCAPCVDGVRRRSFVFRAGREVASKVTGCALLKQDNTSAIFAPLDLLPDVSPDVGPKLPNFCWRKS